MSNEIYLHKSSKFNQKQYIGFCKFCYERAVFRHVMFNGQNSIICTRCQGAVGYYKGVEMNAIAINLTLDKRLRRLFKRLKRFFVGDWRYYPFKIKRKKAKL